MMFPLDRPRLAFLLTGLLSALMVLPILRLRPRTNLVEMVKTPAGEAYQEISSQFGLREQAFLLVESTAPNSSGALVAVGERLVTQLRGTGLFRSVEASFPVAADDFLNRVVYPYSPLFLDPSPSADLDLLLHRKGLRERIRRHAERLSLPGLGEQDLAVAEDPLGLRVPVAERFAELAGSSRPGADSEHYLSADGEALLLFLEPAEKSLLELGPSEIVRRIDEVTVSLWEEFASSHPEIDPDGISVRGTGGLFLAEESERVIRRDLIRGLSVSIGLAALFLSIGLRLGLFWVALLCQPTLIASLWAVGLFAMIRPEASVLAFGCTGVLIGLGIDFTIHLTATAMLERGGGTGPREAVRQALLLTRGRLVLAALTSMAAFLSFLLSDQVFLKEMGLLTSLGLAGCLLSSFLTLPPLLLGMLAKRPTKGKNVEPRSLGLPATILAVLRHRRRVLIGTGFVVVASLFALAVSPVRTEDDLRNIHARTSEPLATQARLSELFEGSLERMLLLVEAQTEEELLSKCHELRTALAPLLEEGLLVSSVSIASLIPPLLKQRDVLARLAIARDAGLARELPEILEEEGFDSREFDSLIDGFGRTLGLDHELRVGRLGALGFETIVRKLVRGGRDEGWSALFHLSPRNELWTEASRSLVVDRIRGALAASGVRSKLTGLYLLSTESARQVANDFKRVSGLTLAMVLCVLAIRFRRVGRVGLVLLPAALGALLTAGVFAVCGFRLNLMNLGVLPMVLAIGIDDGIHIVAHFFARREGEGVVKVMRSTGTGVVLTSLTTMVTFGSLAFSENRGLASVGILSFLGVGGCLVASIVVLPAFLAGRRGVEEKVSTKGAS